MRTERDDFGLITRRCSRDDTDSSCGAPHEEDEDDEPSKSDLLGRVGAGVRSAHDAGVPF